MTQIDHTRTYTRVYVVVARIPPGKVATYGQIAAIVGNCTARMVGYALAALPTDSKVPWQRVINAQGKISPRGAGLSAYYQQELLAEEGVRFSANGKVNFKEVRWSGPDLGWLIENGFDPEPFWAEDVDRRTDINDGNGMTGNDIGSVGFKE